MGGLKATDVRVLMLSRLNPELKWSVESVGCKFWNGQGAFFGQRKDKITKKSTDFKFDHCTMGPL